MERTRNVKSTRYIALIGFLAQLVSAAVHAQSDWKKQWEATVEAAKKEGEVTIYGPHNPVYQQVWAIFQKSYPEIKFSFVPGKGSDHAQRIVAERRAGKFLADLLMGGSSTYASFAPGTLAASEPDQGSRRKLVASHIYAVGVREKPIRREDAPPHSFAGFGAKSWAAFAAWTCAFPTDACRRCTRGWSATASASSSRTPARRTARA